MRTDFLKRNLGLKAASLVIAVILWFFVISKTQTEVSIEVDPQIREIPETLCLAENRPQSITVIVSGNERLIRRLKPEDVRITPSLKEARPGRVFVPVELPDIKVPAHLIVVNFSPKGTWVILENRLKLTLPVEPVLKGEPAEGYSVQNVEVWPDKAVVDGPADEVKDLRRLSTEPFDINGIKSTQTDRIKIMREGKSTSITPQEVRISVTVRRKSG